MVKAKEQAEDDVPVHSWLNQDLFIECLRQDFKEFKGIKEFKVQPAAGKGENYTTVLLRVRIVIELKDGSEQSTSYMAKVLPTNDSTRDMVTEWKVFDKERTSYAEYVPEFEKLYREVNREITFGPKYYPLKKQLNEELIILEDLGHKGFINVNRQKGLDMRHTRAVLEKLAEFHAASAVRYETKGPYSHLYDRNLCNEEDKFQEFRDNQAKSLIKALPLYEAKNLEEILTRYTSQATDMFQAFAPRHDNEFRVLNHGDAWCNNIMFQYDTSGQLSNTYFVDLQMSRYASPAQDLLYLILSSVNLDLKISKFDYFIGYYHQKLLENLKLLKYPKKLPTLRGLHQAIIYNSDWVYPIVSILLPIVLTESNDNANFDTLVDQEADGDQFRNCIFENQRIVKHLKEILPWAYSRGAFEVTEKYSS